MTRLIDCLDSKTIDKVFLHLKESKKKYGRLDNPNYYNLMFFLERLEVMKIIVNDIPPNVNFSGQDVIDYMKHLHICLECTNGWKLYLQRQYRR